MTQPARVLHVFGRLDMGGAEALVMNIYRQMDKEKIQFDFAVHTEDKCYFEPEIESLGGSVFHGIPRFRLYNFFSYKRAWKRFFDLHPYGIVHIHTTNSALPVLLETKKYGVCARILHAHSTGETSRIRQLFVKLNRPFLRRHATHMLAASDSAGNFIFGKGYSVKANAVDAAVFRFCPCIRHIVRKDMGWENDFIVCHTGRFHPLKNHSFLLRMTKELVERMPFARLVLLGDGALRPQIEAEIEDLNLSDKVSLLGARGDVPALLQGADAFVLPSISEGLPVAAVEAQASGLPVFLSDTITAESRVTDNLVRFLPIDNGYILWAEAIASAAGDNSPRQDTFAEIQAAGFDIKTTAKWYEDFYMSFENGHG